MQTKWKENIEDPEDRYIKNKQGRYAGVLKLSLTFFTLLNAFPTAFL